MDMKVLNRVKILSSEGFWQKCKSELDILFYKNIYLISCVFSIPFNVLKQPGGNYCVPLGNIISIRRRGNLRVPYKIDENDLQVLHRIVAREETT